MPEFLSDELKSLRDRVASLATGELAAVRDATGLAAGDAAARVREASKAAGVYALTQTEGVSELALLVVRETLAHHGVSHLPGLFGAGAGLLEGVGEPLRSSHLLPMLAGDKRVGFAFTEPAGVTRSTC